MTNNIVLPLLVNRGGKKALRPVFLELRWSILLLTMNPVRIINTIWHWIYSSTCLADSLLQLDYAHWPWLTRDSAFPVCLYKASCLLTGSETESSSERVKWVQLVLFHIHHRIRICFYKCICMLNFQKYFKIQILLISI